MLRVPSLDSRLRGNDAVVLFARVATYILHIVPIVPLQFGVAGCEVYTLPFKPLLPLRHSRGGGNLKHGIRSSDLRK